MIALCVLKPTIFFMITHHNAIVFTQRWRRWRRLAEEGRHRDIYIQAHIQRGRGRGDTQIYSTHRGGMGERHYYLDSKISLSKKLLAPNRSSFPGLGLRLLPLLVREFDTMSSFQSSIFLPLWWRNQKKELYPGKRYSWTLQWSQVGRAVEPSWTNATISMQV